MTARRWRLVAVAAAALVGTVGGIGAAVATTADDEGRTTATGATSPSATPTPTPTPSPSPSTTDPATPSAPDPEGEASSGDVPADDQTAPPNEPLLYYVPGEIHDGDDVVEFAQGSPVTTLVRRDGGYLVGIADEEGYNETLWTVTDDGVVERIGYVSPGWDLNLPGTRVVANDLEQDLLTVYDTATAEPVTRWDGSFGEDDSAGYAGSEDQVLVSTRRNAQQYDLLRWDVAASTTTTEDLPGYERMAVSPGGSYVVGVVGPDGAPSEDQSFCLQAHQTYLKAADVFWQTCDWTGNGGPPAFSPDGTRLLVIPSATEGLGPSELAVIDASDGADDLVARFGAPERTLEATWADDDHVYVTTGGATFEDGTVERCDLEGACTTLARSEVAVPVVGEVR